MDERAAGSSEPSTGRRRLMSAWRFVRAALIAYLLVALLAMLFEESLIYFPSPYPNGDWQPAGLGQEEVHFQAAEGTRLHGWYVPHDHPRAVVLFCHGNAGNVTHRADSLQALHHGAGVAVFVFDYRGYGRSAGRPSEEGIIADARAARAWLAQRAAVPEQEIVVLGESLGGAVAVHLA
ncbi:MAG: alpha/beta fold hydrolase, partial [Thermoguttaceae bacterium]|nr:alpha/beta fold hydrolase [Thermoguttaceae bacterium]